MTRTSRIHRWHETGARYCVGLVLWRLLPLLMVAGGGFEPPTFGL